jgi:predicted transcriptional regulator
MAGCIVCCRPDDELTDAMNLMREKHVRRLPVVSREGTLIGLLALDDIAYEAGPALRGGVNFRLREQVADAFIAITHGRIAARSSSH